MGPCVSPRDSLGFGCEEEKVPIFKSRRPGSCVVVVEENDSEDMDGKRRTEGRG